MSVSMSFLSTDGASQDELAEKEADEFDLDYVYVFGSQAQYKADNCNGQYGTVIAAYNTEHGGEVANVVYVSNDRPLYLIPSSFFRPSKELLRLFTSNSQRRKRQENFALMDCVQMGIDEKYEVTWVAKASRHYNRLELFSDGHIGIDTIGVLRPTFVDESGKYNCRQLWTEKIGWIRDISMEIMSEYLHDVAYRVRFRLVTHPDLLDEEQLKPETLRMVCFNPSYHFQLYAILAVDDVHQEIVESMVWNAPTHDKPVDVPQENDEQWAFGLEKDKPKSERSKAIKNVQCLTTTKTELYAPRFECEPNVVVRVPWRPYWQLAPGTFVYVTLVYCKWNDWYLVIDHSECEGFSPIPYEIFTVPDPDNPDTQKEVTKLLLHIEAIGLGQFYSHPFCGLVFDRDSLLDQTSMDIGDKRVVWAVHEQGVGTEEHPSNFVIHSIPTPEEMSVVD